MPSTSEPRIAFTVKSDLPSRIPSATKVDPSNSKFDASAKPRTIIDWFSIIKLSYFIQVITGFIIDLR